MKNNKFVLGFLLGLTIFVLMAAFTRDWDEATPTDSTVANQIDEYNRYLRVDTSDRLENMFYGFIAGENTLSQHAQYIQFYEQASISQPSAGYGRLGCKAVGGKCELHWHDEDGDEIQLTTGGYWNGAVLLADSVDSAHYAAASIDAEHLAADIVDETKIADNGIDSEHYNDGSIDAVHIANIDPDSYAAEESITFPNGLIMKQGTESVAADTVDEVTYAVAFPNAFVNSWVSYRNKALALVDAANSQPKSGSETSILEVANGHTSTQTIAWFAIGY